MSLLTDEELEEAREAWVKEDSGETYTQRLLTVQRAKTLKAMAEWLGEYCDNPKHESQAKRIACIRCLWELRDAGTFGKMPGEE